jgi:hypothetical protein
MEESNQEDFKRHNSILKQQVVTQHCVDPNNRFILQPKPSTTVISRLLQNSQVF